MSKVLVVGAGMAGLLAAGMLRSECLGVVEAQPELPNNHSAVLRFRSSVIGNVLNIPFKEVKVLKSVASWRNPVADAMAYSFKTNGRFRLRSIVSATGELSTRYIAPHDFISQMAERVQAPIHYGTKFDYDIIDNTKGPIISTIPMPLLMKILGWTPKAEFHHRPGHNVIFNLHGLDAYVSMYVPNPASRAARISITGNEVVAECYGDGIIEVTQVIQDALNVIGLDDELHHAYATHRVVRQQYGKILPYDEEDRQRFIMWATEQHGIFSLGRFATWRPGLLLDDVVRDVNVISNMIRGGRYDAMKEKFGNV